VIAVSECRYAGCQSMLGGRHRLRRIADGQLEEFILCSACRALVDIALENDYPVRKTPGGDIWVDNIRDILRGVDAA
jgi:hypothetical protein